MNPRYVCPIQYANQKSFPDFCRSQKQKWELATAALDHQQLCLRCARFDGGGVPGGAAEPRDPGLAAIIDMLGAW